MKKSFSYWDFWPNIWIQRKSFYWHCVLVEFIVNWQHVYVSNLDVNGLRPFLFTRHSVILTDPFYVVFVQSILKGGERKGLGNKPGYNEVSTRNVVRM